MNMDRIGNNSLCGIDIGASRRAYNLRFRDIDKALIDGA